MKNLFLIIALLIISANANAANRYFINVGSSWNSTANWSASSGGSGGASVPGSSDVAYFDANSGSCTIDANVNVSGINTAGYANTLTQGAYTITVGSGNLNWVAGTFAGSSSAITVNGAYTLSGGTYTSTSGTFSVQGNFNLTSGTFNHNNGNVTFINTSSSSISGGTFYDVVFNAGAGGGSNALTIVTANMVVTHNLTFSSINYFGITGYNIEVRGDITLNTNNYAGVNKIIANGTGTQNCSGTGGSAIGFEIDKSSGTLNFTSNLKFFSSYTYVAGTVNWNTNKATFSPADTTTITGSTFYDVEFNAAHSSGSHTITIATANMVVTHNLTITLLNYFGLAGNDIEVRGDLVLNTSNGCGTNKIIVNGTGTQNCSGTGGSVIGFEINKASGTLNFTSNIKFCYSYIHTAGTVNWNSNKATFSPIGSTTITGSTFYDVEFNTTGNSGTRILTIATANMIVTHNLTFTLFSYFAFAGNNIEVRGDLVLNTTGGCGANKIIVNGTGTQNCSGTGGSGIGFEINKVSGTLNFTSNVKFYYNYTYLAGTVNWNTYKATFLPNSSISITGTTFYDVEFVASGNSGSNTITIASTNMTILHNLIVTSMTYFGFGGYDLEVQGNATTSISFYSPIKLIFNGTGTQTFTSSGDSFSSIDINKSSGVVNLGSNLSLTHYWQNINILSGTLDLKNYNLTLGGSIKNSGEVKLVGSETISLGELDNSDQGIVTYYGTGTYSSLVLGDDYYDLNLAGTTTQDHQLNVWGDLNISGSLNSSGYAVYLAGDFNNTGSYTSGSNSVYLIGSNQTIVGSNTFNNLIKRSNTSASLTFPASGTQTVAGTLELSGALGSLLALQSSSPSTTWTINHTGATKRLGYLNVTDSTSVSVLDAKASSTNGGNNTNWTFTGSNPLVWNGAVNNNFSNAGNWNGSVAPTANDAVEFLSGSSAVSIDVNSSVAGITLGSSFSGSVTLASGKTLDVGYNGITIASGTFTGNSQAITSSGDLVISGGTFNSSSSAIEIKGSVILSGGTLNSSTVPLVVGGNWTKSGGTFAPSGAVTFNGFGGQVITSGGTDSTSDFLAINVNFGTVTIVSPIKVDGNFIVNAGQLKNDSIVLLTANLANYGGFINDQSGALWLLNGTSVQTVRLQNNHIETIKVANTASSVTFLDGMNADELIGNAGTNIYIEKGKYVVLDKLTLNGTISQLVSFKSNVTQQVAHVRVTGVQTLSYVDVRGIDGQNSPTLDGTNNCVDLGYNINWTFPSNSGKPVLTITPTQDVFETSVSVTISSTGTTPVIYYTLDGSTPTTSSSVYSAPLSLSVTTTIKAISVASSITSNVFGKVYAEVDSALDDGLIYPVKSYGLNAIVYLGDVRRFEGEAWHVGADGLMNTTDDYRVPEFDKYIDWSATYGTIAPIANTGGAIFSDDGYTTYYTVTLTLGANSFTGCNNSTPVTVTATTTCNDCGCEGEDVTTVVTTTTCPPDNTNNTCVEQVETRTIPPQTNSPIPLPTLGEPVHMHIVRNSGFYNLVPFSLGKAARMSRFHELKVISSTRVNILFMDNQAGGWIPFDYNGSGKYFRDGGNQGYAEKIIVSSVVVGYKYIDPQGNELIFKKSIGTNHYRISEAIDTFGNKITYDYQSASFLLITDGSGNEYEVYADTVIEGVNQISKIITKPNGSSLSKTWLYEYDADGFIASEKFDDLFDGFGYGEFLYGADIHGNPLLFQDCNGNEYTTEYDDVWRVTKIILPAGDFITKAYSGKSGAYTVTITDPLNHVSTLYRNQTPYGIQTTKVVSLDGLITELTFDSKNYITQKKQKLSTNTADDIITNYEYDSFHYVTKITVDPSGLNLITSFTWDSNGNKTSMTDPNGVITVYTYTSENVLETITQDSGGLDILTSFAYDSDGNKVSRTDPLGKIETYDFDSFGNLTQTTDELSYYETQTFDEFGNKDSHTDKNGNTTLFYFDIANRLTQSTDPANYSKYFEYDANNNMTRFTDENNEVVVKTYNTLNYPLTIGGDVGGGGCVGCSATQFNGQEGYYEYTWNGMLIQFTDANYIETSGSVGNITIFEYDLMYRKTFTVVDPFGLALATENSFDKLGRLTETRIINHTGDDVVTNHVYDKNSRLITTQKVLGLGTLDTHFEYDNMSHITKITDPNSNFSTKNYDNVYRVVQTIDAEDLETIFAYNDRSELIETIVDPSGFAITANYGYNDRGELITTTLPEGGIKICDYDGNGNKIFCEDPMGGIVLREYDNRNSMTKITDEVGAETSYFYNGLKKPLSMVDDNGTITSYEYGEKSFLIKVIQDVGGIERITEYSHDEYGLVLETTDPSGTVFGNVYDRAYRVIQNIADVGGKDITTSTDFDSVSRVIKTTDAAGFETNYMYDQVSRLTTQSLPDGGEKSFTYDNMSNVLTATSKVNVSQNYVVSYDYNKIYQITEMIEDVGGLDITTQKTYDAVHRLESIIDAKTQTTSYEYDQENRITLETYADSGFISRTYDLDGRLTTKTDQNSDVVSYFYDDRDLLIEQDYGSAGVKLFSYDNLRRKTAESDNNSNNLLVSSSYTYDTLSRQLTSAQQIGSGTVMTDTKVYNAYGEITEHTLPSGKVINFTYTALHQMDAIVSDVGNGTETVANYDYNYDTVNSDMRPLVKKKTLATGTGIHTDFAYDQLGRQVLNDSQNGSNVTVVGFEYAYNLIGNRLTDNHLHKSDESETYSYDTAQRFTNYERGIIGSSPVFTQGYTLDALANWSSFNNNGSTQSRTHDSMNAITAMGTQSVNYDVKGNQTSNINGNSYYWDKLNRLVEIKNISNATIALYYSNTDNLRVEKITNSGTEQFYYSGARVCVETDGSQSVTKEYIHGGQYIDEIITVITGGNPYYYLYDLRYNMYAMVDDLANILERARYEGYGKQELMDDSFSLIGSPLVDQPYSYTGQRLDVESGLQYYRARYFDNDLGRFISRDPIGYVDGLNLYRGYFVNGGVDPSGTVIQVDYDKATCTIKIVIRITIYAQDNETKKTLNWNQLESRIENSINNSWNTPGGWEVGLCKITIEAVVTVDRNSTTYWGAVGDNEIEINDDPNRKNDNFVQNYNSGEWSQQANDWSYAHEAGHLMNLDDDYTSNGLSGSARRTTPIPGTEGRMMSTFGGKVHQSEVEKVVKANKLKCPCTYCDRYPTEAPIIRPK